MKPGVWASISSVAIAAASSACCWLPLVAVGLGFGAAGAATMLERYRWPLIGAAAVSLGIGCFFTYRREEACAPDGSCPPQRPLLRKVNRVILWCSALLVAGFAMFPEIASSISSWQSSGGPAVAGVPSSAAPDSTHQLIRLSTDGHELRDAFNRDVGSVRLVALLSPT